MRKNALFFSLWISFFALSETVIATPTLQVGAPGGAGEGLFADYLSTLENPIEADTAVTTGNMIYLAGNYANNKNVNIGGQYLSGSDWSSFDDSTINFYSHFDGHGAVLMATVADGTLNTLNPADLKISVDGSSFQSAFYTRDDYDFGKLLPSITQEHDPIKNQDYLFFDVGDFAKAYVAEFYNFADETFSSTYGQVKTIELMFSGIDWVHFDLMAIITDTQGQTSLVSSLEGSANSKDVTWKNPVPEPASLLLMGTGLAGLAGFRRKKKKI